VVAAAAERGLGAPLTCARSSGLTPVVRVGGVAAVLFLLTQVSLASGQLSGPLFLAAVGLVGLVCAGAVAALRAFGSVLHLFERGAVVVTDRGRGVEVLPWAELAPIENERRSMWLTHREPTVPVLAVHGARGRVFRCDGTEAVRLADVICSVELPRAWAALRAGVPLRFGPLTLTPDALVVGDLVTPWAAVTRLRVKDHLLVVGGAHDIGGLEMLRLPRRDIPHQRTLMALGEQLAVAARRSRAQSG
jgi:hypothetical protein